MSKANDYIPKNAKEFNTFQETVAAQVAANAAIWNVPADRAALLAQKSAAFVPINAAISNDQTRTRQQLLAYKTFRAGYTTFLRELCQSFLTNNTVIPVDERKAMKLNPRGLNPPSKRAKITTAPIVSVVAKGGGEIRFGFKVEASNKRTARHPLSNGVNVFYRVEPIHQANQRPLIPIDPNVLPPVQPPIDPANTTAADANSGLPTGGFEHYFSTRAAFTRQMPLSDIGKMIRVYAQWVNTTDTAMSSTFSMVSTVVIS